MTHPRSIGCESCADRIEAFRHDEWIRRDGRPEYSEHEVFRFDRPAAGDCDLCAERGARAVTLDVWGLGSRRGAPADIVLHLAICQADSAVDRWTTDDWRWFISGAYEAHREGP